MQHAVSILNFGIGLSARAVGDLAASAERAGWDGFFLWDHLFAFAPGRVEVVDPWVALAVAATRTERIRLGTAVAPLPRRRPVKLSREVITLDHLSGSRVILGLGIGAMPFEWDYLGEEPDLAVRGDMLDEGLDPQVAAHEEAGATWWVEAVHPWRFGYVDEGPWPAEQMAARVAAGPAVLLP